MARKDSSTQEAQAKKGKKERKGRSAAAERREQERKEALRQMLLEKKREIWNELKGKLFAQMGEEHRGELETALDEGDRSLVDLASETGLTLVDMNRDILEKIDRALEKLEEGTYGICEDCGEEISEKRLRAMPFAIYCVRCKTRREELERIEREEDRFVGPAPEETEY